MKQSRGLKPVIANEGKQSLGILSSSHEIPTVVSHPRKDGDFLLRVGGRELDSS